MTFQDMSIWEMSVSGPLIQQPSPSPAPHTSQLRQVQSLKAVCVHMLCTHVCCVHKCVYLRNPPPQPCFMETRVLCTHRAGGCSVWSGEVLSFWGFGGGDTPGRHSHYPSAGHGNRGAAGGLHTRPLGHCPAASDFHGSKLITFYT